MSGYPDTRMQVACKEIMIAVGLQISFCRIVYKSEKIIECKDIIGDGDIALPVPLIVQDIVIAADQFDPDIREIMPPFAEQFQFLVFATVKEIAHYDELPGLKVLYLLDQPLEVLFVNSLGNWDAEFPEMSGLSEMQVCQDQRFFFFPENAPFR